MCVEITEREVLRSHLSNLIMGFVFKSTQVKDSVCVRVSNVNNDKRYFHEHFLCFLSVT